MSRNGRVLVAMSGGVDSSVAAVMLHEQGYEVVGLTMKTWEYDTCRVKPGKQVGCCSIDAMNDARAVAARFGFTHFVVDIREEFGEAVVSAFTSEYLAGRTPNPCVLCNTHIKWDALLRRANSLGCELISTGHYARTEKDPETGRTNLLRGLDSRKDQSYVLWGLPQEHLSRTLLPIGTFEKPQIRALASEYGLDRVAAKPDSYEICFIPDNDYRGFLKKKVAGLAEQVGGGSFLNEQGEVIGQHQGYPFYTIGQRHGLGIAMGYPAYVTDIDVLTNTVTLGREDGLLRRELLASGVNLIQYAQLPPEGLRCTGKIRYKDEGGACTVYPEAEGRLRVTFDEPRRAITPGQSVVLYEGERVVGGGWIDAVPA